RRQRSSFRFERGLRPRNLFWGEVRKGGGAPLRVSIWPTLPSHQLARHDGLHHLGGAVADLEADDVAHALLERQLVGVAVVAVEEQALVNGLHGELRSPPLGHGGFLAVGAALVGEPEGAMAEAAAGVDLRGQLRDAEGNALESGEWLAEGTALLHVDHR